MNDQVLSCLVFFGVLAISWTFLTGRFHGPFKAKAKLAWPKEFLTNLRSGYYWFRAARRSRRLKTTGEPIRLDLHVGGTVVLIQPGVPGGEGVLFPDEFAQRVASISRDDVGVPPRRRQ